MANVEGRGDVGGRNDHRERGPGFGWFKGFACDPSFVGSGFDILGGIGFFHEVSS